MTPSRAAAALVCRTSAKRQVVWSGNQESGACEVTQVRIDSLGINRAIFSGELSQKFSAMVSAVEETNKFAGDWAVDFQRRVSRRGNHIRDRCLVARQSAYGRAFGNFEDKIRRPCMQLDKADFIATRKEREQAGRVGWSEFARANALRPDLAEAVQRGARQRIMGRNHSAARPREILRIAAYRDRPHVTGHEQITNPLGLEFAIDLHVVPAEQRLPE